MNCSKEVKHVLKILEELDVKHPYSIVRCILKCETIKRTIESENQEKQKEIFLLLENYFDLISDFKDINGLKTLINNYELQDILINCKSISFKTIKLWIDENIIKNRNFISKTDYQYTNKYSKNNIENQNEILNTVKEIIIDNDLIYGDVIFRLLEDLNLDLLFFFNNTRYKNSLAISYYSLYNLIIYFDWYISKIDYTFKRTDDFLYKFMITILFDQKNNYKILRDIIQNKEFEKKDYLRATENFLIRRFKNGIYKTKTQYYIKFGINTNSKFKTFDRSTNIDRLNQIYRISKNLCDNSILDLYYLSFINDKDITSLEIEKIDRLVEDIAISNPKAIIIDNSIKLDENRLINDYVENLTDSIKKTNMSADNFTILNDPANQYMMKLFEGKIYFHKNKEYNIKILKTRGMIFAYISHKSQIIFKDRIFTKDDSTRIVKFIEYYDKWGR